ncbi:extensin [Streptomyces umbrinus]|uniref:extensin n=1 Tax=Streptomyces umbrinus TaxID=67370 RepID=UPI0033D9C438
MRSLTPARALTPALAPAPTPAAAPAAPRRATPAAIPLRRSSSSGTGPSVQRAVAPSTPVGRAVPLLSAAKSGSGTAAPVVTPGTAPQTPSRPTTFPATPVVQRLPAAAPRAPGSAAGNTIATSAAPAPVSVQRAGGGPPQPTPARTTTAVSAVTAHGSSASGSASDPHKTDKTNKTQKTPDPDELPDYTPVAKGQFDPRSLTDFQLDELTHRLIGRITRLVRTELRLDRERIGKLRDPRR